ncbi:MAG: hypothetical protein J5827_00585 [Oscillospiraceae bacterium]|nr:hypothetical protein [Oscillospiraceae bacterium]
MFIRIDRHEIQRLEKEQLKERIVKGAPGIFFIDGPTGCGKTRFMKELRSEGAAVTPFCDLLEEYTDNTLKGVSAEEFAAELERRSPGGMIGLEDIDICLMGKKYTQTETAALLVRLSAARRVVVTGIEIDLRCGELFGCLKSREYGYYLMGMSTEATAS